MSFRLQLSHLASETMEPGQPGDHAIIHFGDRRVIAYGLGSCVAGSPLMRLPCGCHDALIRAGG